MVATVSQKDGLGRSDRPVYSEFALQEAIVNALAHRDYELAGSQVIVTLFPDRIEIRSPGALHNTLTPENLYAGCQPVRRNQLLAGFFRDYVSPVTGRSYMEARGEGFLTLVRTSLELSGRRPELEVVGKAVRLTLFAGQASTSIEV
jgi:predicted HTH transcriptional regulator